MSEFVGSLSVLSLATWSNSAEAEQTCRKVVEEFLKAMPAERRSEKLTELRDRFVKFGHAGGASQSIEDVLDEEIKQLQGSL